MKKKTFLAAASLMAVLLLAPFAFAAGLTPGVTLTVTNSAPTVPTVVQPAAKDPTSCATTSVTVQFNASDVDGITDLDLSASYVNISKGAVTRQLTTCVSVENYSSDNTMAISCTGNMQYYDAAGTWDIKAVAVDNSAESGSDATLDLTYNAGTGLMDVQYTSGSAIAFGNVAKGSTKNMDTAGFKLRNCGNVALNNSVDGADITGSGQTMAVGQFRVDDDTDYDADTSNNAILPLTTAPQDFSPNAATGIPVSTGSDSTWSLYFFVNVPAAQAAATYDTGSWTFAPSAA